MSYIDVPITTDDSVIAADTLVDFASRLPGWVPREGQVEVALVEALAVAIAENRDVVSQVPKSIYRYFGKSILGLPAVEAASATTLSTWTASDDLGHLIPANSLVAFTNGGTTPAYFQTIEAVSILPGATSTNMGEVALRAIAPGAAYNGFPAGPVQLLDALSFVSTVTTTQITSGGDDAETDDEYLDRLRALCRLLAPRPIRAEEFSIFAQSVVGVARAKTVDNYNADTGQYNQERTVGVALVDAQGNPVSDEIHQNVRTYLESLREVNFVVTTMSPGYQEVDVTATLRAKRGFDPEDVRTRATAAMKAYLDPATWDWSNVVRYTELISLLDRIDGVDYVDALVSPADNIVLSAVVDLVKAGRIDITVQPG